MSIPVDETIAEERTFSLDDICGHTLREFSFGPLAPPLRLLCVDALSPADSLLLSQEGDASTDLTGHCIWLSARLTAALIQHNRLRLAANSVFLELGAGTGYLGIALALAFAHRGQRMTALLTDGTESAVRLLRMNVKENAKLCQSKAPHVEVHRLVWGQLDRVKALQRTNIPGRVDYVFAADCIYEMSVLPALFETAFRLLGGEEKDSIENSIMRIQVNMAAELAQGCFIICNVMNRLMEPDLVALDKAVVDAARRVGFDKYSLIEEAASLLYCGGELQLDKELSRTIDGLHIPLFCFWV